jgi:acyl carrier protein
MIEHSQTIAELVRILVDRILGSDTPILDTTRLREDLGADSLDIVTLVLQVEADFNLHVSDEELDRLATVGELVALVQEKTRA